MSVVHHPLWMTLHSKLEKADAALAVAGSS